MLKKWLPKDETDLIPEYPYTFVGVGGLLIKDDKVLMVKERYAISSKWKLPGTAPQTYLNASCIGHKL